MSTCQYYSNVEIMDCDIYPGNLLLAEIHGFMDFCFYFQDVCVEANTPEALVHV